MLRIGIDVSSMHTDAVLMDANGAVAACAKVRTSTDMLTGIAEVLQAILQKNEAWGGQIADVVIGTDYFEHALQEGKQLAKVCAIRIGQAKSMIPPLYGAPAWLQEAIGLTLCHVYGGHELDGSASLRQLTREEVEQKLRELQGEDVEAFAITGTFSPVSHAHEGQVAAWIREMFGADLPLALSHELGSIGFLERENATILNAALSKVTHHSLKGLRELIRKQQLRADIYVTQNDGSLLTYDSVLRHPIRTFGSRISDSFRGAALLTRLDDCIVVDVSPSAVCVGALEGGFPKENRRNQKLAGVRVNLQMPDVILLPHQRSASAEAVDDDLLDAIYHAIQRFQPRFEPLPVVFVGEGSEAVAAAFQYPWAEVIHPPHFQNVSAIGACIAPVSGSVDRIYWLSEEKNREETIQLAKAEAIQAAIRAGAVPETVFVQSVETIPLAYMPTRALRMRVKAIGKRRAGGG